MATLDPLSEPNPLSTSVNGEHSDLRATANAEKEALSSNKLQEAFGANDTRIAAEPKAAEKLLSCFQELSQEETEPTFAMVAGYMKATNTSVSDYIKKLEETGLSNTNTQIGTKEVFDLTWNQLSPSSQEVAKFTCTFSYSYSEAPWNISGMPWYIIEGAFENVKIHTDNTSTSERVDVDQAKLELLRFGLMKDTQNNYSEVYHVHPIVKELFISKMSPEEIAVWGDLLDDTDQDV